MDILIQFDSGDGVLWRVGDRYRTRFKPITIRAIDNESGTMTVERDGGGKWTYDITAFIATYREGLLRRVD